jgi:hypothetical protein
MFGLDAMAFASASGLDTKFMKTWMFGGELTDEHLAKISNRLTDLNRFGAELIGSLQVMDFKNPFLGREDWGVKIRLDQRSVVHGTHTNDLYNLIFLGNKKYASRKANISPSGYRALTWQKLGIGFFDKKNLSGLTISFVSAQNLTQVETKRTSLYTSPMGDTLSFQYAGYLLRSDTALQAFGAGNGVGAALDGEWNIPLVNKKGWISVRLQDVGVVKWNNRTLKQSGDTTFTFTGFEINDLIQNKGTKFSLNDSLHLSEETGSIWQWLPARAIIMLQKRPDRANYYEVGMEVRPTPHHVPRAFGAYGRFFMNDNLLVKVLADFGGYGKWNAGLSVDAHLGKNWYISANTWNVPGFFMDNAHTLHGAISLRKFFAPSKWTDSE